MLLFSNLWRSGTGGLRGVKTPNPPAIATTGAWCLVP